MKTKAHKTESSAIEALLGQLVEQAQEKCLFSDSPLYCGDKHDFASIYGCGMTDFGHSPAPYFAAREGTIVPCKSWVDALSCAMELAGTPVNPEFSDIHTYRKGRWWYAELSEFCVV